MSVLVDTNVLLRRTQRRHEHHAIAVESVAQLLASGEPVHFTTQNVCEFWNVITRPTASNGLGFSIEVARREIEKIERVLLLLPDSPALYDHWKDLVREHRIVGSKVHDARLVAAMRVHQVGRILTFNIGDFVRYRIEVLHPAEIAV